MASAALSRFLRPAGFDEHEDPQAAPGVCHSTDSAKPWTLRRGLQNRLWLYLCGLVFLVFAINSIWEGDPSREVVIARSVAIGVIAVAYVLTAWMVDMSIRARWVYVGGFFALLAATSTVWGWSFVYYGVLAAVGHRQPPHEVGHPGEGEPLELGVLVEEVVDVPGLVADDEVVGLLLDDVEEHHEVGDEDLVHPPDRLEGVQIVLGALVLHVGRLVGQPAVTPDGSAVRPARAPG